MDDDWEEIKVNRRKGDKVRFESPLFQQISDGIDYLRDESKEILRGLDSTEFKQNIDEFDLDEFGENTLNQISDIADDLSQFKSELFNSDDVPDFVKESSINAKRALNKDADYVRRARRRLDRIESDELVDVYKTNLRVIVLCDKAVEVNSKNREAYYLKGLALVNLEKYDEAIEEFINSLALEDDPDVRLKIADSNRLNREFNDAISVYNSVSDVKEFEALTGKAYTYYDWQKYGQANMHFKKAASIEELDDESKKIWDECKQKSS
jgi:tetratricopeptide (TPR) repeat protein